MLVALHVHDADFESTSAADTVRLSVQNAIRTACEQMNALNAIRAVNDQVNADAEKNKK